MAKVRASVVVVAGCLMGWTGTAFVEAAPTVSQVLNFRPKQEGIVYTTPTAQELESCKVELVTGSKAGSNGWLLRDARGLPLRRFFDSNGDKKVDQWSYYLDGVEVYREIDSNHDEKVDQYRWLNAGGMKWGIDYNEDGKIDVWKTISAEEVSQELLQAVVNRDVVRLQALFLSETEMKALDLPAAEANRLRQLQTQAPGKFQATLAKLSGLGDKTHWVRLEVSPPQCLPADQTGTKQDLIKYTRATVLYENNNKHDFLTLGELIQVGPAWRLVDAPGEDLTPQPSPELQIALERLRAHDAKAPKTIEGPGPNPDMARYNLLRADLILDVLAKDKADQKEMWIHQLADSLSAAAQSSPAKDKTAYERLLRLAQQLAKDQPGSNLAGYVTYREMQADYNGKLIQTSPDNIQKVQTQWVERLAQFVQTYPKCDDTPEALRQAGMVSEFISKEIEAKNWYLQLVKDFPNHPLAENIRGALRRLEIEGKEIKLAGPQRGSGAAFDITRLRGKLVVVYYWASWNQQCVGDFARMRLLLSNLGGKGLEVVCVNLDSGPPEAGSMDLFTAAPGVQLVQTAGLDSPLATYYGIMSLPTLFLVGPDGKVISRSLQVGNLEEEIKKNLK